MPPAPGILTTIVAFALVLGPLVLVHELGHYLVGRWFGVKADAFSIGFGKELAGWTDARGTRWKLSALPLGGYVQFAGDMNPASAGAKPGDGLSDAERRQTFNVQPLRARALIVLAGPLTNLLCAVAIITGFSLVNGRSVVAPVVAGFVQPSDAQAAGVRSGDCILAIDDSPIDNALDVPKYVVPYPGRTVMMTLRRDARVLTLPIKLTPQVLKDNLGNTAKVADLGIDFQRPVIKEVIPGSPAARSGVRIGDRITAVDGTNTPTLSAAQQLLTGRPDSTVRIEIARGEARLRIVVKLEAVTLPGSPKRIGRLGVGLGDAQVLPVGPIDAVRTGFVQSVSLMRMMADGLGQIVTGERSVRELGGPVSIARLSGEQLSLGWAQFVGWAALISINLAFINLLPIPGLDGGHLAFYAAEAVRRRPLAARGQEWAFRTGLALVVALMLFVTINDLAKLPVFGG